MTFHAVAHYLAAGLPELDVASATPMRPRRFAAATHPLRGRLGEHLYCQLRPGGETAIEAALLVSDIPKELSGTLPSSLSLELLAMSFPVLPAEVIPDELTPCPLPFSTREASLVALDHGDVVARRAEPGVAQLLRAWLSTSDVRRVWS